MTSERMLLGKQPDIVAALYERRNLLERADDGGRRPPLQILSGIKPRRTSKPSVCPDGFSEPTATIVWGALLKIGVLPDEFVLWNAFPWHSFDPRRGLLSNRMPNKSEQAFRSPCVLKAFLELFPCEQIVALGKIAAAQLEQLDVECALRSPSSIRRRQTFSPANRQDREQTGLAKSGRPVLWPFALLIGKIFGKLPPHTCHQTSSNSRF